MSDDGDPRKAKVDTRLLERRLAEMRQLNGDDRVDPPAQRSSIDETPLTFDPATMNRTVGKLEGQQEGLKQSQTILVGAVFGLAALFFALAGVLVSLQLDIKSEVGKLDEKLVRMSDTLRTEMRTESASLRSELSNVANAIANSITATRQTAPQIIVVPAPVPQPPSDQTKP